MSGARAVVLSACLVLAAAVMSSRACRADSEKLPGVSRKIDWNKIVNVRTETIGQDFPHGFASLQDRKAFESDLDTLFAATTTAGIIPDEVQFRDWWAKNKSTYLKPDLLSAAQGIPVTQYFVTLYLNYLADQANRIDAKDPHTAELRKHHEATKGDNFFVQSYNTVRDHPWAVLLLGGGWGALKWIGNQAKITLTVGPGGQMASAAADPVVNPIIQRIQRFSNNKIGPKLTWWTDFASGEWGGRRQALKAAKKKRKQEELRTNRERGKENQTGKQTQLSAAPHEEKEISEASKTEGEAAEPSHLPGAGEFDFPGISQEDFIRERESFYNDMIKATYRTNGFQIPLIANARDNGFNLIYASYENLSERLNGYQTAINTSQQLLDQISVPHMLKAGATQEELDRFSKLVRERQRAQVYDDPRSPKAEEKVPQIRAILDEWLKRGVPKKTVREYYTQLMDVDVSETRPVFALASFLDAERYYQQNNKALAGLDTIQKWQEQAREMSGIYYELEKYRDDLEKFYKRKGINYDVMERVGERGYPLGGRRRPKDQSPVLDCVLGQVREDLE